jgi:hypothetical protein
MVARHLRKCGPLGPETSSELGAYLSEELLTPPLPAHSYMKYTELIEKCKQTARQFKHKNTFRQT